MPNRTAQAPPTPTDMDETPLRLMIYDATCRGPGPWPGLTGTWWAGARLYRALGRFDAWRAVRGWDEALAWLATCRPDRPIAEVQYWGHGTWGQARIGREVLDVGVLAADHPLHRRLDAVRGRLLPGAAGLWWWRTCQTFGAEAGRAFARRWADHLGCRVAGHTFVIGPWQSGLHALLPGQAPDWSPGEGLREGTPARPGRARWSRPGAPRTVTCLAGRVPAGW